MREFPMRGKKLHKEMLIYWRRKDRELQEIRRRKERIELELKKREDEERET